MSHRKQPQVQDKNSARSTLKTLDTVFPIVGSLIILGVSALYQEFHGFLWIAVGMLCIEVSLLKIIYRMVPEQRQYNALRAQTNQFLALVRQLNNAALRAKDETFPHSEAIAEIRVKMIHKVDQLIAVAGKTDGELQGASLLHHKSVVSRIAA